jgi:uncharacterized protein DUF5752
MPTAAKQPFRFWTRLTLTKLTGRRAVDLAELSEELRTMPPSVVFYHTHHFLVQHQHLSPEPPNDFAFWVSNVLQEEMLGERLAAIDTVSFQSLKQLRDRIVSVIDAYLEGRHALRTAPAGEEFHFRDAISFTVATPHEARTLVEFRDELRRVGYATIAYHLFEARLRVGADDNDFSRWLERDLDERDLAAAIRRLDPYTHTMEGLRQRLIRLIDARLPAERTDGAEAR